MKIDLVEKYRKVLPTGLYSWQETEEVSKQVCGILFNSIDLGSHSASDNHKSSIYRKMSQSISTIVEIIEMCQVQAAQYEVDKEEDKETEDYLKNVTQNFINGLSIRCPYCEEVIPLVIDEQGTLRAIDNDRSYTEPGRTRVIYQEKPNLDGCFEFKKYEFEITAKTNKFVVANNLRPYLPNVTDHLRDCDINSIMGSVEAVRRYAKNNVLCTYVGNTSIRVTRESKDVFYFHEGYTYDAEQDEWVDIDIHGENLGAISCSLWWIMAADQSEIDMVKLIESQEDHFTIDVEPGATYVLEYDMTHGDVGGKCFKFLKKTE